MTTSTVNPAIPVMSSALASVPVRNNFLAAYNDINALWAAISAAGVSSINGITGSVVLAQGSNITLTPSGNTITISSTGGGGGGGGTGQTITASNSFSISNSFLINNVNLITPSVVAVSVDPTAITPWTKFTVKDAGGVAGANNITITPTSGNFDSQSSFTIFQNFGKVSFYSDGTNLWT